MTIKVVIHGLAFAKLAYIYGRLLIPSPWNQDGVAVVFISVMLCITSSVSMGASMYLINKF